MEWSDLKIFLAIARAGSLAGAARLTGQTQPTMGRRLSALEEAVGSSLFQRTPRGYVLTAEGSSVLVHAERIEDEVLAFERKLAGQDAMLDGLIRVSSSDWFGLHMLTPVFTEYGRKYPNVIVELVTDSRLFSLARREADLVFRIKPFDEPDVIQRKLMHIPYGLYAVADRKPVVGPLGEGMAVVTMNEAFGEMPDAVWLRRVLPKARLAFRSNNRDVQARMCMAGIGFAILPRPLGDSISDLQLVALAESPPGRDVWLGYHRDAKGSSRLKALLDITLARLSARA
ncbi:MAG: LysR family transcriptional regulator [Hydrogenophaga sp.]|uniref:LysR family transcriptional regulator n=1 Tax=Hydrogenophaga crocea TaxID=2716225 RepID=A0A6G8IMA2_9BURK|nr:MULTISPECIES: LysR family transcriptional regulator [Hydrogenophaga]MBL0946505.1 LysR family transcriptional regulator [Hydrogenophaga sp.]QIM54243.1 LysR family transcriptional regulator [Hydrogenophaga crocea]